MPLKPGWFSMHHGLCPHRPTHPVTRRIGLGLNYIATNVKPSGSIRQAAMLVRGVDRHHHFEAAAWPKIEFYSNAIAAHERATSLYRDAYLEEEARHARSQVAHAAAQEQHGQ